MRTDELYLRDILNAITEIEKYAIGGREALERQELIRIWTVYHIQIIGEATQRLSQKLKATNPQVPWAQIAAMRNILVHSYFKVDLDEVWAVVEKDLPCLEPQIRSILANIQQQP